jgi:hypothetical protein
LFRSVLSKKALLEVNSWGRYIAFKLEISGTSTTSGLATSVDPRGYLASLNSVVLKTEVDIGDTKRACMLFDSLVKSSPKHTPGWITASCLEEHAGPMVAARKLVKAGREQCPKSDDVWLETRLYVSETFVVPSAFSLIFILG